MIEKLKPFKKLNWRIPKKYIINIPINIAKIDFINSFPQPLSASSPKTKAAAKKPNKKPPVGPIKYGKPPP